VSYDVWTHDGSRPELLGSREDKAAARRLLTNTRHGAVASNGSALELRDSCGSAQAKALKAAIGFAWVNAGNAPPTPLFVGPVPTDKVRPLEHVTRALVGNDAAPPKLTRPAGTRPPTPRRQTAPAVDELAPLRHRIEQLESDLSTAVREMAAAMDHATRVERERDDAEMFCADALALGLAECERLRARPATVDELQLARVATRAAREAVRVTREDARLRALAERVGGVEALEACVAGTERLLRRLA
jgi:hypothetical protein